MVSEQPGALVCGLRGTESCSLWTGSGRRHSVGWQGWPRKPAGKGGAFFVGQLRLHFGFLKMSAATHRSISAQHTSQRRATPLPARTTTQVSPNRTPIFLLSSVALTLLCSHTHTSLLSLFLRLFRTDFSLIGRNTLPLQTRSPKQISTTHFSAVSLTPL